MENWPGTEVQRPLPGVQDRDPEDVRRKEIGGELNAAEVQAQNPGQRQGQRRLAHSRQVFQKEVPPGEETGYGQADGLLLPEDNTVGRFQDMAHPPP